MSCLINDEPGYSNLDDDSNGALDVRVGLTARHYLESYLYRDMNTLSITTALPSYCSPCWLCLAFHLTSNSRLNRVTIYNHENLLGRNLHRPQTISCFRVSASLHSHWLILARRMALTTLLSMLHASSLLHT